MPYDTFHPEKANSGLNNLKISESKRSLLKKKSHQKSLLPLNLKLQGV